MKILSGFASDLAKISGDPPETPLGGSPGGLRTISAGTTSLVHTVFLTFKISTNLTIPNCLMTCQKHKITSAGQKTEDSVTSQV